MDGGGMMAAMLAAMALAMADPAPVPEIGGAALADAYAAAVIGRFSSAAQHAADPRYDVVEARISRIWPERTDGIWLYQEQAIVNQPGMTGDQARQRPYFQFVARIAPLENGVLRRDNYRVADGAKWRGMTSGDARLASLTPADLAPPSCHNRIELVSRGHFVSQTESCANAYRGAAMMVSRSLTTPTRFVNWDRGLAADGAHVWGPRAGGYIFERVE